MKNIEILLKPSDIKDLFEELGALIDAWKDPEIGEPEGTTLKFNLKDKPDILTVDNELNVPKVAVVYRLEKK